MSVPTARRRLLAVGAIAAPVLAALGGALTSNADDSGAASVAAIHADPTATIVSTLVMTVGAACFIAAFGAFAALAPRRTGGVLTTVGVVVGGFGAAVFAGALLSYSLIQLSLPNGLAIRTTDALNASALGSLPWAAVYLVVVGSILSSVGLLIARAVSVPVGILLVVGVLLTWFAGDLGAVSELLWLPFAVGVALAVRPLLRDGEEAGLVRSEPVGVDASTALG